MLTKELKKKQERKEEKGCVASEETSLPLTNVYADEGEIHIESEIGGVDKDSLEISLENNLLTIYGSRAEQAIKVLS